MDKKYRKLMKQIRKTGDWYPRHLKAVHWQINERAEFEAIFKKVVKDGKIGVITSGMDCDCCQYYRESLMDYPKSLMEYQRNEEKHRESLDGPESRNYVSPDRVRKGYSKSSDRALEAYEDGHPHYVTLTDLS